MRLSDANLKMQQDSISYGKTMVEKKSTSVDKKGKSNKTSADSSASKNKADSGSQSPRQDGVRETVESIVIAFILAFLIRTFEAEAFVIPTGSMAPTLYGRHKVVECDQCHYHYTIGASDELDKNGYLKDPIRNERIRTAFCPNCRYEMPEETVRNLPVFKGDRILVNKFPYEFADPQRWDVLVFKYPEEPKTNYIKRLVGLPGETLAIRQGDVYRMVDEGNSRTAEILRKDAPDKQKKIQILVYNNDFPDTELHQFGWPQRWASVRKDNAAGNIAGWSETDGGWEAEKNSRKRVFRLEADRTSDGKYQWLRYRHFVPSAFDWDALAQGQPFNQPRPQLIDDFCGYNATTGTRDTRDEVLYWVGDLTLTCQVDIEQTESGGMLQFELNEGFRKYRCRIDPSTGEAELYYPDPHDRDEQVEVLLAKGKTRIQGPGSYTVVFANVDSRLCLWVDGKLVEFDKSTEYEPFGAGVFPIQQPTEADLTPVGIAARNLTVRVSHLLLERDIYYRGEYLRPGDQYLAIPGQGFSEYNGSDKSGFRTLLSNPNEWWKQYQAHLFTNSQDADPSIYEFVLGPEEYFVMGDNSPLSRDSRVWPNLRHAKHRHAVPKSALVGKAFFIYWPHGVPFLNDGKGYPDNADSWLNQGRLKNWFYHQQAVYKDGKIIGASPSDYPSFRVPFYPNVERMQRIR